MQIETLAHKEAHQAQAIWRLRQQSYQIEADLIEVADFPPLSRTWQEIAASPRLFVGCRFAERLVALAEYSIEHGILEISSLIVSPDYFRQGYADRLMAYLLALAAWTEAIVDTAQANQPAIGLYQKWGFVETNRWLPEHGIPLVRLSVLRSSRPKA
ncbi:MAG: GNAT family N-acetyltransferase [Bacteroidota bacterium]